MIETKNITDQQRLEFLRKLIAGDLLLTEWETQFTGSFHGSSRPTLWFTPGRRISTDKMWMKYGADLGLPYPGEMVTLAQRNKVPPPADAGACEYIVRDEERRQRRCNEPAVLQSRTGFRYCQTCADKMLADMRRLAKSKGTVSGVTLYPIKQRDVASN